MGSSLRGLLPKRFETREQARDAHRKLVRDLELHHPEHPAMAALRDCEKGNRCFLEVCPMCRRVFRRQLASEARRLGFDQQTWTRVSLIPKGWRVESGELFAVQLPQLVAKVTKALERKAPGLVVIGGIDISWNTWKNGDGHWQVHLYYLVLAPKTAELELALRSAIKVDPKSDYRSRPFLPKQVRPDGFFRSLTYSYKSEFGWKSYYPDKRLRRDGTQRRNVDNLPLARQQRLELAMWFQDRRIGSRLIVRGMRRTNRPGSKLSFQLGRKVR
jgi:hypothetical protein